MDLSQDLELDQDDGLAVPPPKKFKIAWFCPLRVEQEAAVGAMDMEYDVDMDDYMAAYGMQGDMNIYRLAQINGHRIVICRPPDERAGPIVAAMGWRDLSRSFPNIRNLFIVGIGGGAPNSSNNPDIRLGDVVIGLPRKGHPGMIQIDAGHQNDSFRPLVNISEPPPDLQALAYRLIDFPTKNQGSSAKKANIFKETADEILEKMQQKYPGSGWKYPGIDDDCCFVNNTICVDKATCPRTCRRQKTRQHYRSMRASGHQVVHGGLICSSSKVIRDANFRDETVALYERTQQVQIVCFEMEGYVIASEKPCLDIRGISDYSDCHKTSQWQPYAAVHAAAAAKIITGLLIDKTKGGDAPKPGMRKDTGVSSTTNTPESRPKPLAKASTFGTQARDTTPTVTKRATTNPPSLEIVTKQLDETDVRSQSSHDEQAWYQRPIPTQKEVPKLRSPDQVPSSPSDTSSSFSPQTPRRPKTEPSQWMPVSPFHTRMITEEPDMSLPYSSNKTSVAHRSRRDNNSIDSISGQYVEDLQQSNASARTSSFSSAHAGPSRKWSAQSDPRFATMHRVETIASQTQASERSSLSATHRVISTPSKSYPENYMLSDRDTIPDFNPKRSCRFTIKMGHLETSQSKALTFYDFGEVVGFYDIQPYSKLSQTMPSKLLTFQYEVPGESETDAITKYIQFWVPVDDVDITENGVGLDAEWSDSESVFCRRQDGRSVFFREYNARIPNVMLYIEFDNDEEKTFFRTSMQNHNLEGSSWIPHGDQNIEVKDAHGQTLKAFYRHDNVIRGAGVLITTVGLPKDGSGMKVYCMKPLFRAYLEHTADAEGSTYNFKITGLCTLGYLVDQERRDYFLPDNRTRHGKPDRQHYKDHNIADNTVGLPVIKLSKAILPAFLEMIFDWTLVLKQQAQSIQFKRNTKNNLMILHYKHINGRLYIVCCNMDAKPNQKNAEGELKEWFLFEVNRDPKKGLSTKKQVITIPIKRWTRTNIVSLDQFQHRLEEETLKLSIDYAKSEDHDQVWHLYSQRNLT